MGWKVKLIESERGWGQDVWYREFDTEAEAEQFMKEVNSKNVSVQVPNCYIIAEKPEYNYDR